MSKKIVYQTDVKGYYIGEEFAYNELIPFGAVEIAPPTEQEIEIENPDGTKEKVKVVYKWNREVWEYVENHIGEKGFINNETFEVKEYGPLPAGFTLEKVYTVSEARKMKDEESFIYVPQLEDMGVKHDHADLLEYTFDSTSKGRSKMLQLWNILSIPRPKVEVKCSS